MNKFHLINWCFLKSLPTSRAPGPGLAPRPLACFICARANGLNQRFRESRNKLSIHKSKETTFKSWKLNETLGNLNFRLIWVKCDESDKDEPKPRCKCPRVMVTLSNDVTTARPRLEVTHTAYEEGGHAKEFGSVRYMFKSFRVISFVIDNAIMDLNLYHSRSSNHTELGILKFKCTFAFLTCLHHT